MPQTEILAASRQDQRTRRAVSPARGLAGIDLEEPADEVEIRGVALVGRPERRAHPARWRGAQSPPRRRRRSCPCSRICASTVFSSATSACAGGRLRRVLVNHAARGGLERGRHRARRLRNVAVDEPREPLRTVTRDRRMEQKEELILPLGEVANRRQQARDVAFLLPSHDGRRMLARGRRGSRSRRDTGSRPAAWCRSTSDRWSGPARGTRVAPSAGRRTGRAFLSFAHSSVAGNGRRCRGGENPYNYAKNRHDLTGTCFALHRRRVQFPRAAAEEGVWQDARSQRIAGRVLPRAR